MHKSFKRFILLGAPAIAAALLIFSWPAAEAQQPPFPIAPQAPRIEGPPRIFSPPLQAPLFYPVPPVPVQALIFQQPQPAEVQPQPKTPVLAADPASEAIRDSQPQTVTIVEVLHIQRNLYFGFSSADYSESGKLGEDYGLANSTDTYLLKADLDLFTFRYAIQFNKHSEIIFGINHSQKQELLVQEGNQVENIYTSLSVAAKEKLPLPFKTAIYGYVGVAYSEFGQNASTLSTSEPITPPKLDGLSPIYGAGIEWDLIDNLGVFLEYGRIYEQERKTAGRRPRAIAEGFTFGLFVRL